MVMSLEDYLYNPQGKGSVSPGLKLIKSEYDMRYGVLIDKHKDFETHVYAEGKKTYLLHVKLPSETYDGIFYDVLVRFEKSADALESSIANWKMSVISNSPSFVFTYTNVFRLNRMFIGELKQKVNKEAYTEPAKIRNPYSILGPEKNLYYVLKYIRDKYSDISLLQSSAQPLNYKELYKNMKSIGTILDEIKKKTSENRVEKVREKKELKSLIRQYTNLPDDKQDNAGVKFVKRVVPVKNINTRSNIIKPIKKR